MYFISLLQSSPEFFISFVTILGLFIGSFLNVVIYRLPLMMKREWQSQCDQLNGKETQTLPPFTLSIPRSHCPHCKHTISASENIPLISYIALKGICKQCKAGISARYPLVEILSATLSGIIAWQFGFEWSSFSALLLTWALIVLTFIDIDHQLLPDSITLPLIWLGIFVNLFSIHTELQSSIIGAMAGYLSFWLIFQGFKLITNKEGMGYGDFKLLAALGAWLGWSLLPSIILLSSLIGVLVGISLILLKQRQRDNLISFGPYLAAVGWLALIWGAQINTAYLDWLGL